MGYDYTSSKTIKQAFKKNAKTPIIFTTKTLTN